MSALALAATLMLGLSTPAPQTAPQIAPEIAAARSAPEAARVVSYGDLNLASATGADALDARINAAARRTCAAIGGRSIAGRSDCLASFREEAMAQLPAPARQDYARAQAGRIEL